jgi:hypothetical protein
VSVKEPLDLRPCRSRAHPRTKVEAGGDRPEKRKEPRSQLALAPKPPPHWSRRREREATRRTTWTTHVGAEVWLFREALWHMGMEMPQCRKGAEGTSGYGKRPKGTGRCGKEASVRSGRLK